MPRHSHLARDDAAADMAACRTLLSNGSRTFLAASLLLPARVRDPACALYAFCRLADDAVDAQGAASDAVLSLRDRLASVYRGVPYGHAADRALARVVREFAIPRTLPEALLEGFEWDAAGRRYETLADLHGYAARVAGTVGAMMALLMGVRSEPALARACDLGVAMQLSNIARDVGEDARMGRLYLPREWLREAGVDPDAWLARPVFNDAIAAVVARLLRAADVLYARVGAGVAQLPLACRPGINAARFLYAQIGHEVARRGMNSVDARAVVSGPRKLWVLLGALGASFPSGRGEAAPPLPATRFLVDAAVREPVPERGPGTAWGPAAQAVRVIELFERLERRERGRLSTGVR
jgi:phytoene synthase